MNSKNYLFLIGAPKAGTSSIAAAFRDSPQVAVARIKEPCFFTDFASQSWQGPKAAQFRAHIVSDWDTYDGLFGHAPWRLDASTDYMSCPVTPDRLAAFAKENTVKIVAVLRDPVARILSEFQHTLRDNYQSGTLAASLDAEGQRTADNWHPLFRHTARSRYAAPIQRYRALFGDAFRVVDFHTFQSGEGGIEAIADFIGVPPPPPAAFQHENRSFAPRSRVLNRVMNADSLVGFARRTVPSRLRSAVRGAATQLNATTYTPTDAEIAHIRATLADDIAWCVADPDVPTDHWTLARG